MDTAADLPAQLMRLPDRGEFMDAASEMLSKLFPGFGVGWASFDARTGQADVVNWPDVPSVSRDMLLEVHEDHPLIVGYLGGARGQAAILRMSDLISDRALRQTRTYREALWPAGVDRQFAIRTSLPGEGCLRAWAVTRQGTDFSDCELELAEAVRPMLRMLDLAYAGASDAGRQDRADGYSLTAREHEILQLLGKGLTGVAIGHLLGISARTVAKHLEHAYAKLGCTNRIDALRKVRGGGG